MTRTAARGFTLIEVAVAIVLLGIVAVSLVGSSRITAASVRRASLELDAAQLIHDEFERLRTEPIASLVDGAATHDVGISSWLVTDSGSYLRVELVVRTNPIGGSTLTDTLYVYRPK